MQENTTGPIARVHVTGDGKGVTGQAGTHLLGRIANRLGVGDGLADVMDGVTERSSARDRGIVLTQLAMMVAAGGRCVSDLATLRDQPVLFGDVASDATAWRAVNVDVDDDRRQQLPVVRQGAVRRLLVDAGVNELEEVTLDVDATLLHLDSEGKQGAGKTFKGGWGFAPMLCFIEPFGLPAGMLRPGGATANNASDQLSVIDQSIAALPADWRAGHRPGDDADEVVRRIVMRADTAGGTNKMLSGLATRNVVFAVGMRATDTAADVMKAIDDETWQPAINADGKPRDGAQVAEVADLVPDWAPAGTRAIVRRERPHPGASLRLWDHDGLRHQVTLTNDTGNPVDLELAHRRHAQVENRIKNLKDTGLSRLPFSAWTANLVWFEIVLLAALLLAALQTLIGDDHDLSVAEPRRLRYTLLAIAARVVHRHGQIHVRLDRSWPWTRVLIDVHRQLDTPSAMTTS